MWPSFRNLEELQPNIGEDHFCQFCHRRLVRRRDHENGHLTQSRTSTTQNKAWKIGRRRDAHFKEAAEEVAALIAHDPAPEDFLEWRHSDEDDDAPMADAQFESELIDMPRPLLRYQICSGTSCMALDNIAFSYKCTTECFGFQSQCNALNVRVI